MAGCQIGSRQIVLVAALDKIVVFVVQIVAGHYDKNTHVVVVGFDLNNLPDPSNMSASSLVALTSKTDNAASNSWVESSVNFTCIKCGAEVNLPVIVASPISLMMQDGIVQ